MHYKNGREAKNGDKVMLIPSYGAPVIGILYDAVAHNDYCNGKLAPIKPTDPCPNLKECLHLDDVLAALPLEVPNSSVPSPFRAPGCNAPIDPAVKLNDTSV